MVSLSERKDKEIHRVFMGLQPYSPLERTRCPFRGFTIILNSMVDSKGNQCALVTDSYDPCRMETAGDEPNWSECPFNMKENEVKIQEYLEKMKVFPREFHPPAKPWAGLPLKDWMNYIDCIHKVHKE